MQTIVILHKSMTGRLDAQHFDILKNEKVIASVDVQQEEFKDSYFVDISERANVEVAICILFALSWIMKSVKLIAITGKVIRMGNNFF